MIHIETWMFFIPTALGLAALAFICYLFYKNVIVPEQQEKAYWQEKYRYSATAKTKKL